MAITATLVQRWIQGPRLIKALYLVSMDSSYLTGGETLDLSDEFPSEVYGMNVLTDDGGYKLAYVRGTSGAPASGKIKAYWVTSTADKSGFPQVASSTDIKAVQPYIEFTGR